MTNKRSFEKVDLLIAESSIKYYNINIRVTEWGIMKLIKDVEDSILEHPNMDGIQLTCENMKGHWMAVDVEDFNVAGFDSNVDCHITIYQNEKNNDLCIHPDGTYESEELEDEKIDQFQVLQSKNFIFYYGGLILFKTELFTEMICKLQKNKEDVATKIQVTVFKRVIYEDSLR